MHASLWLVIFAAMGVAACSPTQVVLRNPPSGEIAECRSGLPEPLLFLDKTEPCAQGYEQQGFARLPL